MTQPPDKIPIYHITHVDNLASIVAEKAIWSDAECLARGCAHRRVGITEIKDRRLRSLEVRCHPGTKVGDYVPFYFCPRSIMLFLFHKGNHQSLDYHGGQEPILHLQVDMHRVVAWADANGRQWAFSDRNAGTAYANFYKHLDELARVNWEAVHATDFRDPLIKDGKQAEFLLYGSFPWELVEMIGVYDRKHVDQVDAILAAATGHKPLVSVQRDWYY